MLSELVTLFDVDNTLLDNDRFQADLGDRLEQRFGAAQRAHYWELYEKRRATMQVADYLGTLQDFRLGLDDDGSLLGMSDFLLEYPFTERVYPGALDAISHMKRHGNVAVLSDGDIVFQPRKIEHAGIWRAVDGNVMICIHKEKVLDHVRARYPAKHYVMVDDKPNLLAAMKTALGDMLTTVFVRQGHYAVAPTAGSIKPVPDVVIERIADLINFHPNDINKVRP
jgi:FMN phosphatase YigB (HAD superfamily)